MSDDYAANLPAPVANGEIVVSPQPEGVLVGGDPAAVESYLARIREIAGSAITVVGVDKGSLGNATGLLAGAVSELGQSGKFVQLSAKSVEALKVGNKIPGEEGFYRMMTRGADGKFLQQLQWKPTGVNPQRLMSLQMVAVQLALKSAIAEVEDSVRRVEDKVEAVLRLAEANRAGNVLGTHTIVTRRLAYLEKHGSLPDADWDAVAGLGPALNVTVEQLRNHVVRVLTSLDPSRSVQERADKLRAAVNDSLLGETLSLLVVAEETLYKWQRLRLARVEATQPDQLLQVIQDARDLLAHHLTEDGKLYQQAHQVIDGFARAAAIDGIRFWKVRQLADDREKLRIDLDAFANARRNQVDTWAELETPGVRDAAEAGVKLAKKSARKALGVAGQGLMNLSELLADQPNEKEPVVKDQPPPDTEPGE